jgi:dipeptidyl aminopeptidase/acylaminoacyl peptidase
MPAGEFRTPVDVKFKAEVDGSDQYYVEMLPKKFNKKERCDVLIALHGHGSDRWQYVKEKPGVFKATRDIAAKYGMIFVAPDYRGTTSWMGPHAEADLVQIIAEVRGKYKVKRVFLTGASMGGASVLIFAALHPEMVNGVSSGVGTANMLEFEGFQNFIAASYGGDKLKKREEYKKRSPELVPEKFIMPVSFVVGGKDDVVPPHSVRRLAKRLQQLKKKDVLMIDRENEGHHIDYEETYKALEFVVIKAAK